MAIHSAAATGYQRAADAYERGRPEYPADAIAKLIEMLDLRAGRTVVDLAAGTGKLARGLVTSGAMVVAIEPVEAMRAKFGALLLGVEIREGVAERTGLGAHSVDAVAVGQAFHWFDGDAALREIHRVLKPGGRLALVWNARDESVEWVAALTAIIDRHEGGAPRYRTGRWKDAFARTDLFSALEHADFVHAHELTPEQIVDRALSVSFIAALTKDEQVRVADEVRELLARRHRAQGRIVMPYRTTLYWCGAVAAAGATRG